MNTSLRRRFVFALILITGIFLLSTNASADVAYPYGSFGGSFNYDVDSHLLNLSFSPILSGIYYSSTDRGWSSATEWMIGATITISGLYNSGGDNWTFDGGASPTFSVTKSGTTLISGTFNEFSMYSSGASQAKLDAGFLDVSYVNEGVPSRYLALLGSKDLFLNLNFSFTSGCGAADFTCDSGGNIQGTLAVSPEPISSILFITGGVTLAFRRYFMKKREAIS